MSSNSRAAYLGPISSFSRVFLVGAWGRRILACQLLSLLIRWALVGRNPSLCISIEFVLSAVVVDSDELVVESGKRDALVTVELLHVNGERKVHHGA